MRYTAQVVATFSGKLHDPRQFERLDDAIARAEEMLADPDALTVEVLATGDDEKLVVVKGWTRHGEGGWAKTV